MFFPLPVPEELDCKFFIYIKQDCCQYWPETSDARRILNTFAWRPKMKKKNVDCATASIKTCQMFSVPEASVQPQIFWFPTIHDAHPKQPHIILQKCLDGEECPAVLTVQADQLPDWESWTFVPPLLPRWLHEMTWATLNRKPSTSKGYGCLSKAIHQAQKRDGGVRARPKKQG